MKLLLLAFILMLSACTTTVPVKVPFPQQPLELREPCPPLQAATSQDVREFTKVVITNYEQYHNCQDKVNAWQTWYLQQKQLYEELTK